MTLRGRIAVVLWLAFITVCATLVSRAHFTADLSAFLPRAPTAEQQLLVDQLKSGIASRLILIGIEGGTAAQRSQASRALAEKLRTDPQFLHAANGETTSLERDQQVLFDNRYQLSPAVSPALFTVEGLEAAVADSIDQLASSTGLLGKRLFPHDPTGEFMHILDSLGGGSQPRTRDGVWVSRDDQRALLLVRTQAEGSDTDGQERALHAIRSAFEASAPASLQLVMTGPGPFSVEARDSIKQEVARLSGLGVLIIMSLLLLVYRSPRALFLGLLPVLSGALAGIAAVSLGFGTIHGVTLGFGTALIGEAVDYSIYLFMQSEHTRPIAGEPETRWIRTYWPTIRIGVFTSVFGFASLLFSGFPGLAQLGLYAVAGLTTAALVTRFVLPHLLPGNLHIRDVTALGNRLQGWRQPLTRLRWPLFGLFLAAIAIVTLHREPIWNQELSALSPVSSADQALDASMRADMGAPDVRYLVVVTAADMQAALAASERISQPLRKLVDAGVIADFEGPATYLPSMAMQQQRLASLPNPVTLRLRFQAAIAHLPLRPGQVEAFFSDVEAARQRTPLQREDIEGTSLAQGLDALLVKTGTRWAALMPLRAPAAAAEIDADTLRTALAASGVADVYFVDLKGESDRLYTGYLREAILLSLVGLLAIAAVLFAATRSAARVVRIVMPLAMAVVVVVAGLVLAGQALTILHLVGMLLIVAVGSNYALFFDQDNIASRTLAALLLAVTTTVAGFGLLGFSSVPVLNAIGTTVGPGAILALLFSAILARRT